MMYSEILNKNSPNLFILIFKKKHNNDFINMLYKIKFYNNFQNNNKYLNVCKAL